MKAHTLTVYLPDTRGVEVSRYGKGNLKIGRGVYTYSRLAGRDWTCPGSSEECEAVCYAKRIKGVVRDTYEVNSMNDDVPPIPEDCRLLRLHISGDFDTKDYILNWYRRIVERPDITVWAYTRSWRVPELLPALELMRALPHVQLIASMDKSTPELPPKGWRRAWIDGDARAGTPMQLRAHHRDSERIRTRNFETLDGTMTFICPEETKHKRDCESCRYCFDGQRNDVTFLLH